MSHAGTVVVPPPGPAGGEAVPAHTLPRRPRGTGFPGAGVSTGDRAHSRGEEAVQLGTDRRSAVGEPGSGVQTTSGWSGSPGSVGVSYGSVSPPAVGCEMRLTPWVFS